MIDAIYRAESGTQNRVKAKLSPRTTREFLTSKGKLRRGFTTQVRLYLRGLGVVGVGWC